MNNLSPIHISKRALQEIRKIITQKNIPDEYGLRIGVKTASGCAGLTYALDFDKSRENDLEFGLDEIKIIIKKRELMYLIGKEVDYYQDQNHHGFIFSDEQGKTT